MAALLALGLAALPTTGTEIGDLVEQRRSEAVAIASDLFDAAAAPHRGRSALDGVEAMTAGFGAATWVPGTVAHSWQAVAAGGISIGHKGMMLAATVFAATARQLYVDPKLVAAARTEFEQRRGNGFVYRPLLGDRTPPLDYRR